MDKCRFCGLRGLILSTINADYSCEHCGEWQNAVLNSAWEIINYERESKVMDQDTMYWSELAELTHATQVERFNFCTCEDNEGQDNPYNDCPKENK